MTACLTAAFSTQFPAPMPDLRSVEQPDVLWKRSVGPGWDVVLIPPPVASQAVRALTTSCDLVGAVFALDSRWGFFLPEQSDEPAWPDARYLSAGSTVILPPSHWRCTTDSGPGWVRRPEDGRLLTPPLVLHPVVAYYSNR